MANRSVVVDLIVRTNQFTAGMRRASHDMASETTNMETKTRALQMQIGLLGVGMVAFAAVAVKKWADFDQAMARVSATGGEAAKRIDELNEAAKSDEVIELGYSATEASEAIYELVKAGVSAQDIIGGGMAGAMALAAAETMDAGDAAQIMASALTQFNLAGSESAHVADLIVAGAGKAQGSAHDLGLALKQSGLVADQFGLSIEETTGTLAFFASAGLIGSDAGTSLRTMLLHLAGPSTKAARLMDQIGLEIYKSNGEMVNMEELADNLQNSMGKLTEQQRNQALATIFGADATRAASLLYREGGDAVVEWTEKVDDAGYALDVARKRMDNLNGDVKKMSATFERSMIELGQSADAPLRGLVQGITSLIDWFGDLDPAIHGVIMALTGGGGLVILATLGIAQIVSALGTLNAGLVATGVIAQGTGAKVARAFGKGAGIAGAAAIAAFGIATLVDELTNLIDGGGESVKSVEDTTSAILKMNRAAADAPDINEMFNFRREGFLGTEATDSVENITEAMDALTGRGAVQKLNLWASSLDGVFGTSLISSVSDSDAAFKNIDQTLTNLFKQDPDQAAKGFKNVYAGIDQTKYSVEDLMSLLPDYAAAQIQAANDAEVAAQSLDGQAEAIDGVTVSTEAITAAEIDAKKAHDDYISAIVESFTSFMGLGDVYQGVIDNQKALAESAAEESKSTKDSWEDFYDGTTVSADQYIAELQRQVEAQEAWAANLISLTDRAQHELPANMRSAAQEMINELRGLGPEGAAQIQLLNSMSATELAAVVELYNRQGIAAGEEWAAGVEAAEIPEVDADTKPADDKITTLQEKLDAAAGRHVTIPFDANIKPAMSKLATLQAAINATAGKNVPIPYSPETHGRATGGAINGPGTGTSDSIPARLSNGEHVLTASDVTKAGGQEAVYRMRGAIQSGMLKFASGGAVGGKPYDYWQRAYMDYPDRLRLLAQIEKQKADLASGEVGGLDRQVLAVDLGENQTKLREAEFAASLGNQDYWNARVGADKNKSDYTTDIKRGSLKDDLTGGGSSALSAIDRIRNDVLPNMTGAAKNNLTTALYEAEKAATHFYKRLDEVDEKLGDATDKAKELRDISDGVKNNLAGGFSLDSVAQSAAVNPFTGEMAGASASAGKGMLKSAQAYAVKVKTFATKLKALADKGFSGVILQEIAAMGVDAGIPAADALLALNIADTKALNQAYEDIATFGGAAGQAVTEGFFKGGVAAADGLVAGLESQKGKVEQSITDMAEAMQEALKKALGIASPARKIRKMMNFVGQGAVLGIDDQRGAVADAAERLFSGVLVPGGGGSGYGRYASGYGSEGVTASLSDEQVERLAVAFETGNVRNINKATAQKNRKMELTYGARGR